MGALKKMISKATNVALPGSNRGFAGKLRRKAGNLPGNQIFAPGLALPQQVTAAPMPNANPILEQLSMIQPPKQQGIPMGDY